MCTFRIAAVYSDAVWVRYPRTEDPGVFQLVKSFGNRIFSIAKRITQNDRDAESVLIETFVEACSDPLEGATEEKVWLRLATIAAREALARLRDRGEVRPRDRAFEGSEAWRDAGSAAPKSQVLEDGIRSLDPLCRTVFVLRDLEELSLDHIAKIVNRSAAAVDACLLKARLALREMLWGE